MDKLKKAGRAMFPGAINEISWVVVGRTVDAVYFSRRPGEEPSNFEARIDVLSNDAPICGA